MTHEEGIKAAFNIFDNAGSQQDDADIELAIQAYLTASGMVLVPADQVKYLEAELELTKGRIKDRDNMLRNLAMGDNIFTTFKSKP